MWIIIIVVMIISGGGYYFIKSSNTKAEIGDNVKSDYKIAYKIESNNASECEAGEKYDDIEKVCYYECKDKYQCDEIEKIVDTELSTWSDEMAKDKAPTGEKKPSKSGEDDMEVIYKVTQGEKISLIKGNDSKIYRDTWDEIAALSPDTISNSYIESYEIYNDENSDTLAFVDDQDNNGKWRIAVNMAQHKKSDLKDQNTTIIHELGHIISLNTSQLTQSDNCPNLKVAEGCTNKTSYANNFWISFWKGQDRPTFSEDRFVSDYATTNEIEDLAESWAFFVVGVDRADLGNSVKDEKLKFFYQYTELVSMRKDMRNVLGRDILRTKHLTL